MEIKNERKNGSTKEGRRETKNGELNLNNS